jgi:hypothetical protein
MANRTVTFFFFFPIDVYTRINLSTLYNYIAWML